MKHNEAEDVFSSRLNPGPLNDRCTQLEAAETQVGYVVESGVLETGSNDSCDLPDAVNVYHTALFLREKLLSVKSSVPFPPTPSHLSEDKVQVPPAVYNFLSWLPCGDKSEAPLCLESCVPPANQAMHRRILSLGQDLIFNATRGHIKTAKHVALPIALKHLTGSTQAVTILN